MNEQMPTQAEREQWHFDTNVRLARLAMDMSDNFAQGHNAYQTDEYWSLYRQYRQLNTDSVMYDTQGENHGKSYLDVG